LFTDEPGLLFPMLLRQKNFKLFKLAMQTYLPFVLGKIVEMLHWYLSQKGVGSQIKDSKQLNDVSM